MQIHNFTQPTQFVPARAKHPFEAHGYPDLDTFRAVHGGDFCTLPEGHADCHPGFRPYRSASGEVFGLKV